MVAMKIPQVFRNFRYKCWSSSYSYLGKYHVEKYVGNSYFDTYSRLDIDTPTNLWLAIKQIAYTGIILWIP